MTRIRILFIATVVTWGAVVGAAPLGPAVARADDAQLAHVDAILHAKQQADVQVKLLNTQLAVAMQDADQRDRTWSDKVKAAELTASNAVAAQAEIESSWAYWIGWIIVTIFKWWLIAFVVTVLLRLAFAIWFKNTPLGYIGANVTTWALHLLTCGLTLATNIPDNLYFLGEIKRLKAERRTAQLAATTPDLPPSPAVAGGEAALAGGAA